MSKSGIPDRLYINKRYKEDFQYIRESLDVESKNVFFMAMAYGFLNNCKEKIDPKEEFVLGQWIKESDEALMKAVAILDTGNLGVILDKSKTFSIAEEYASGGLKYLKENVMEEQFGNYIKRLEEQLVENYKKISFGEINE